MKIFEANISFQVVDFFNQNLQSISSLNKANDLMLSHSGIKHFFAENEELKTLKELISEDNDIPEEPDRAEYGDFQTNPDLANKAIIHLTSKNISPEIIVEPTCGKGNFIIASLKHFKSVQHIFGIEIYKPYVWETKFSILKFFLEHPQSNKPEIQISHSSVFDFDFKNIQKIYSNKNILILGNPPWVTNSKLGSLNSSNLPKKTNFKNHNGLDAITGKGNFDIAEYITLMMLDTFQATNGHLLLLIKNSVIKNIVFDQLKNHYKITSLEKQSIDSKKEFDVSVEASLFYCKLNSHPEFNCTEFNFYKNQKPHQTFGWLNDKFVSNIDAYQHTNSIDGESPFVWRQGLKHDCSAIMELNKANGYYINGLNEEVELEDDLVYGILKSSDLKNTIIKTTRKFTIVTQKKVGQETKYIKSAYPKTYQYLAGHQNIFDARKSSIYNNKPAFSIFGIGDYSFQPFKVAISGLYKTFQFTLVLPQKNRPVMLDDTCYFLGFDKIEFAAYALILLNSNLTMQLLQSITFADAKRTFTKDVLMRIDLLKLAEGADDLYLEEGLKRLNKMYGLGLTLSLWDNFIREMMPINSGQLEIFV